MAQIKINSKIVIEACSKAVESYALKKDKDCYSESWELLEFAKYAEPDDMYLDKYDFALIGEFLPNPETCTKKQELETKLKPGDLICSDCKKLWPADYIKCPHCGNDVPF